MGKMFSYIEEAIARTMPKRKNKDMSMITHWLEYKVIKDLNSLNLRNKSSIKKI